MLHLIQESRGREKRRRKLCVLALNAFAKRILITLCLYLLIFCYEHWIESDLDFFSTHYLPTCQKCGEFNGVLALALQIILRDVLYKFNKFKRKKKFDSLIFYPTFFSWRLISAKYEPETRSDFKTSIITFINASSGAIRFHQATFTLSTRGCTRGLLHNNMSLSVWCGDICDGKRKFYIIQKKNYTRIESKAGLGRDMNSNTRQR